MGLEIRGFLFAHARLEASKKMLSSNIPAIVFDLLLLHMKAPLVCFGVLTEI